MEGKKRRALGQNCHAVSEVYGQLLMISIVVLAFSTIALTVFSDGGAVKPEHIPHTDLQESFKRSTNTVQIVHSGGEAIDLSAIKIIIHKANGDKREFYRSDFKVKNPDGTSSSDGVFALGDYIEIDTSSMKLGGEDIDLFFVDIPSQQVIQRAVLQRSSWEPPKWITPHPYGSVYSESNVNSGFKSTESVAEINDGLLTDSYIPKGDRITENYTFGIDANEMGISNLFTRVFLRIIYNAHDKSTDTLTLRIFNGTEWIVIASSTGQPAMLVKYNDLQDCVKANLGEYDGATTYNITQHVKTTSELEKLVVSFSAEGNAANESRKVGWVDFVGIHVD